MQHGVVRVRVDYGRLILEWVIVALVVFAAAVVILSTRAGVKPGVPQDFNAWAKSHGWPPFKSSQNNPSGKSMGAPPDFIPDIPIPKGAVIGPALTEGQAELEAERVALQTEMQDYNQYLQSPQPPDESGMNHYLLVCFLLGVAALVLAGLYPPWLGVAQDDLAKLPTERPTLVPAGYGWLWRSHRAGDKQAEK